MDQDWINCLISNSSSPFLRAFLYRLEIKPNKRGAMEPLFCVVDILDRLHLGQGALQTLPSQQSNCKQTENDSRIILRNIITVFWGIFGEIFWDHFTLEALQTLPSRQSNCKQTEKYLGKYLRNILWKIFWEMFWDRFTLGALQCIYSQANKQAKKDLWNIWE